MTSDRFGIVGQVIAGAYQVEAVVAEGGFGVVYRAHHGGFRAPVALKCLKVPQHLSPTLQARFLEQFRAEGEVMFRLSASIPTVARPLHIDAMTTPTGNFVPFMVLEWLEGDTLEALILQRAAEGRPPFELGELITLLEPVATALERAHRFSGPNGVECIVHRDLKPENVFVTRVGGERNVKLLDYGIARARSVANEVTGASADTSGLSVFTPAYGAPEQWDPRSYGETGPFTDVWGLALTLVEALAGRHAFEGSREDVRKRVLDPARRPTPRRYGVTVSDAVEAVFARALAVDPRERFPEAGSFFRALSVAFAQPVHELGAVAAIPDLDVGAPANRRASSPNVAAAPSPVAHAAAPAFDFDEPLPGGASLDLDLPPDEPRRRSVTSPEVVAVATPPVVDFARGREPAAPPQPPSVAAREPQQPSVVQPRSPAPPLAVSPGRIAVREEPSTFRRLLPALSLIAASLVITLFGSVYSALYGEILSFGPIKLAWIAGLLLLTGVGLGVRAFAPRD
jgi:serine/threonine-protein kinase